MSGGSAVSIDGGTGMEGCIIGILSQGSPAPLNGRPITPTIIHHERFLSSKAIYDEIQEIANIDDTNMRIQSAKQIIELIKANES
jgi:hypothetical protein